MQRGSLIYRLSANVFQVAVDLSVDTRTYAKKKRERRQKEVEEAKKEEEKEEVEEEMKEEPQDVVHCSSIQCR